MAVADGKSFEFVGPEHIKSDFLEAFAFDSPDQYIRVETNEFSAVCPFSGLPDIAQVVIEYFPTAGKAIELKSLKYYFVSFRMVGLYQEGVTKRIHEDLVRVLGTSRLRVTTVYATRGGMDTTCIEGDL